MLKLQVKGIRNESRSLNRVIIREVLSDRVTSEQRPEEEKSKPCGYGGEREIDQHPDAAVQVPDRRVVLEHLSAQQNGEAHHGPHEGVKPWKRSREGLRAVPSELA